MPAESDDIYTPLKNVPADIRAMGLAGTVSSPLYAVREVNKLSSEGKRDGRFFVVTRMMVLQVKGGPKQKSIVKRIARVEDVRSIEIDKARKWFSVVMENDRDWLMEAVSGPNSAPESLIDLVEILRFLKSRRSLHSLAVVEKPLDIKKARLTGGVPMSHTKLRLADPARHALRPDVKRALLERRQADANATRFTIELEGGSWGLQLSKMADGASEISEGSAAKVLPGRLVSIGGLRVNHMQAFAELESLKKQGRTSVEIAVVTNPLAEAAAAAEKEKERHQEEVRGLSDEMARAVENKEGQIDTLKAMVAAQDRVVEEERRRVEQSEDAGRAMLGKIGELNGDIDHLREEVVVQKARAAVLPPPVQYTLPAGFVEEFRDAVMPKPKALKDAGGVEAALAQVRREGGDFTGVTQSEATSLRQQLRDESALRAELQQQVRQLEEAKGRQVVGTFGRANPAKMGERRDDPTEPPPPVVFVSPLPRKQQQQQPLTNPSSLPLPQPHPTPQQQMQPQPMPQAQPPFHPQLQPQQAGSSASKRGGGQGQGLSDWYAGCLGV